MAVSMRIWAARHCSVNYL